MRKNTYNAKKDTNRKATGCIVLPIYNLYTPRDGKECIEALLCPEVYVVRRSVEAFQLTKKQQKRGRKDHIPSQIRESIEESIYKNVCIM